MCGLRLDRRCSFALRVFRAPGLKSLDADHKLVLDDESLVKLEASEEADEDALAHAEEGSNNASSSDESLQPRFLRRRSRLVQVSQGRIGKRSRLVHRLDRASEEADEDALAHAEEGSNNASSSDDEEGDAEADETSDSSSTIAPSSSSSSSDSCWWSRKDPVCGRVD
jgi:hypothetical protein